MKIGDKIFLKTTTHSYDLYFVKVETVKIMRHELYSGCEVHLIVKNKSVWFELFFRKVFFYFNVIKRLDLLFIIHLSPA